MQSQTRLIKTNNSNFPPKSALFVVPKHLHAHTSILSDTWKKKHPWFLIYHLFIFFENRTVFIFYFKHCSYDFSKPPVFLPSNFYRFPVKSNLTLFSSSFLLSILIPFPPTGKYYIYLGVFVTSIWLYGVAWKNWFTVFVLLFTSLNVYNWLRSFAVE